MNAEIFTHYKTDIKDIDIPNMLILAKLNDVISAYNNGDINKSTALISDSVKLISEVLLEQDSSMMQYNYPYRQPHLLSHASLMGDIIDVQSRLESGSQYMSINLTIGGWQRHYLDHIDQYDSQWAEFLKRQNNS